MRMFETGSDAAIVESLPPLDAFVRPLSISMDEKIALEIKGGRSAFLRALAHLVDEDCRAATSDFQKARAHFSNAAALMEPDVELKDLLVVYGFRGYVGLFLNAMVGDRFPLSDAAADFEKCNELFPMPPTYYSLGMTYWRMGASDKALQNLEKAIELDPEHAHAYLLKGRIHQANGETDAAYDYIYEAILLDPELYRDEFKPIVEDAEKWDAVWDETLRSPDSVAMLQEMVDKSRRARGKKK